MTLKCRGGILADDMGMGKSLTLLALILHTLEEAQKFRETQQNTMMERGTKIATKATLLIAPKSSMYLSKSFFHYKNNAKLNIFLLALYNWQMQIKEFDLLFDRTV
jgi:SNF2 family DNA or RNA helicase